MFNNIYVINFWNLILFLVPPFLRKPILIDWLNVLIQPLTQTNFSFKTFRRESIYKVTHNGTVVMLQKVLNDAFDPSARRIRIVDSIIFDPLYIYPESDLKPVYVEAEDDFAISDLYVYADKEIAEENEVDFIIQMPRALRPITDEETDILEIQISSLTNYYKLASKRYKILWIL